MSNFNPIIHRYPYTDYHSMNLDFLMNLACESMGLHLVIDGKYLKLVNQMGQDVSKVVVSFADVALQDKNGNDITAYVLSASTNNHNLILTKGDGTFTTITIPYSVTAEKDVNNNDITSYVRSIDSSNNSVVVTFGDNTTFDFTVPYAVKARDDKNGKDLTTYVSNIEAVSNKLVVKDGNGSTLAEITVPYAEKANKDADGDVISNTYGVAIASGITTVILRDKTGVALSEITVPYAEKANKDVNGNEFISDYGATLGVNGSKIALNAHDGSNLSEITVPFATTSQDATNAIKTITISGDTVVFTTTGGQSFTITVPYATKALKDSLNNTLTSSYVANVVNDPLTGKISFYSQDGTLIAEMIPTVDKAVHDSFNNTIADYIKSIVTDPASNYVTVTHGDGDTDSITIEYATRAYKDTYGNVIGNVYIKRLAFVSTLGVTYLVAYNGENSELFRVAVPPLGGATLNDLANVNLTDPTEGQIIMYDSLNDEWINVDLPPVDNTPIVIVFNESNSTITSITLWGDSEQMTYQEVDAFVRQGHPIYCNNSGTPLYIISDYVTIANNSFVQFARDVNNGQGRITHRVFYSMNLSALTYTKDSVEVGSIRPNLLITDTPSGNMQPNEVLLHYVNVTVTRTTDVEPIIVECGPTSVDWNTAIPVYNAFIRNLTSTSFQIVYSTANLTSGTQAYGSSVRIKLIC